MKKVLSCVTVVGFALLSVSCEKMLIGPEPENSAKGNFELLWKTFDENYALLGVKRVNWDSLHAVYGSRITPSTTESELWDIATQMLAHLDDGHVTLVSRDYTKVFNAGSVGKRPADDFSLSLVTTKYLVNPRTAGAGILTYGKIQGINVGYLYVRTYMASQSGNGIDWAYDIDGIVREFSDCNAIVVDVRNNGGGLRVTGNIINAAFIDHEITYFYSRRKTGPGHDQFGDPLPISLAPRPGAPQFTKKLVLLTNRFSGSGSEYTAQLFKQLPYATQVGDTTFGAFGEILNVAQLPNGWIYWYPCTLTTTPEGNSPEGIGILPDVLVENTKADINAGTDRVMDYAIRYLTGN